RRAFPHARGVVRRGDRLELGGALQRATGARLTPREPSGRARCTSSVTPNRGGPMRRLVLATLVLAAALAPAALAKEPTAALISGPGLSDPISLGWGPPPGTAASTVSDYGNGSVEARVMLLAEGSGVFPGVLGREAGSVAR